MDTPTNRGGERRGRVHFIGGSILIAKQLALHLRIPTQVVGNWVLIDLPRGQQIMAIQPMEQIKLLVSEVQNRNFKFRSVCEDIFFQIEEV